MFKQIYPATMSKIAQNAHPKNRRKKSSIKINWGSRDLDQERERRENTLSWTGNLSSVELAAATAALMEAPPPLLLLPAPFPAIIPNLLHIFWPTKTGPQISIDLSWISRFPEGRQKMPRMFKIWRAWISPEAKNEEREWWKVWSAGPG